MTNRQARVRGQKVRHLLLYNWGEGVVIDYRDKDNLGLKTSQKVLVEWSATGRKMWMRSRELRIVR